MTSPAGSGTGPILVAIDFSDHSRDALAWAVEAAIAFNTSLVAVHVVHDPAEAPGYYQRAHKGFAEDLESIAQEMMDEFIANARKKISKLDQVRRVDTIVVVGLPETRIVEVAEREGARGIVIGAQGRTALADTLLGSTVERVTRLAPIPVTIVKPVSVKGRSGQNQ